MHAKQVSLFPTQGTYLLLEKLRYAVYRRLLKRVWVYGREVNPDKLQQVPLARFQTALNWVVSQGPSTHWDVLQSCNPWPVHVCV